MARPVSADTANRIIIHTNGGHRYASIEDILAEMRSIRCIEHEGRLKFVTPFVGAQVEICKAFGFDVPDGCAPAYTSRKKSLTPRRGRPAKPKVEQQEL